MVDAMNTFNFKVALHSMQSLCPSLTTMLINTYRIDVPLFTDGQRQLQFLALV